MKRGKAPPIPLRLKLTRGEKLHKAVFKTKQLPEPSTAQAQWLKINCGHCAWKNVDLLVTSVLAEEDMRWKHICCHPGPTKLVTKTSKSERGLPNCSGFMFCK